MERLNLRLVFVAKEFIPLVVPAGHENVFAF